MATPNSDVLHSVPQLPALIISGGQRGADYGGLLAAQSLDITTGGVAPKGFLTERGPQSELGTKFGLTQSPSSEYSPRTRMNMRLCDVCIIVAHDFTSTGTALTKRVAIEYGKPVFEVHYGPLPNLLNPYYVTDIRTWLNHHKPEIINVAGNRESKAPGIEQFTYKLIRSIFLDGGV